MTDEPQAALPRCIVVGGGVAGLVAARTLVLGGADVVLIPEVSWRLELFV